MKKKLRDLTKPATVGDLDDLAAQIITAITKALEDNPTKDDIKDFAAKTDIQRLEGKIDGLEKKVDKLDFEVSDIHRRVIDLEVDTVSRKDFNAHLSG